MMDFNSIKLAAADMPSAGERGTYTAEFFLADFPQFKSVGTGNSIIPQHMLDMFVDYANSSVLPSRWGSTWRYAAGLYVAHYSAMYLKTYSEGSVTPGIVAAKSQPSGTVKRANMGDTQIEYDNTAVTLGMEKWGEWNATLYGQQLIAQARFVGLGGTYVI